MQKTKVGISVGMIGAAVYFAGLFGGYIAVIILAGYILLCEENEWLRRSAVKAVALLMVFSFFTTAANLVPNVIGFIDNVASIFGGSFKITVLSDLIKAIVAALNIIQKILLLSMGIKALNQGTRPIPIVVNLINKYM